MVLPQHAGAVQSKNLLLPERHVSRRAGLRRREAAAMKFWSVRIEDVSIYTENFTEGSLTTSQSPTHLIPADPRIRAVSFCGLSSGQVPSNEDGRSCFNGGGQSRHGGFKGFTQKVRGSSREEVAS